MHFHYLDQYHKTDSHIHALDPRVKVVGTLGFILACTLTPVSAWLAFGVLFLIWAGITALARVPHRLLLRRGLVALPFALAALSLLFTSPGQLLLELPVGPWQLTISDTGLARFVTVMLKSWLSVLAALLLTASTPFPEMLTGLRGIGVPRVLVAIIAFMFRYAFILADEALRLMRAREARSARPSARIHIDGKVGGSLGWRARVTGGMVGNLFVRSFERSERIYNAMLSRGYAGDLRTLQSPALRPWHLAAGGSFLMLLGLVELMARW